MMDTRLPLARKEAVVNETVTSLLDAVGKRSAAAIVIETPATWPPQICASVSCTALIAARIKMMTARMAAPPIVAPAIATEIKVLAAMLAAAAKTRRKFAAPGAAPG